MQNCSWVYSYYSNMLTKRSFRPLMDHATVRSGSSEKIMPCQCCSKSNMSISSTISDVDFADFSHGLLRGMIWLSTLTVFLFYIWSLYVESPAIACRTSFIFPSYDFTVAHYGDVIMGTIASQITSLIIVYSIVYSDADQRKHQSSASLASVRGIHRGPVNSPHKWPVTRRKMLPFDDVIMSGRRGFGEMCNTPNIIALCCRWNFHSFVIYP